MAERVQTIIARVVSNSSDIKFEIFKKVLDLKPKFILEQLHTQYPNDNVVKFLFEQEEKEEVQEIVSKSALLEYADLFNIENIYIYGFNKNREWLHLYTKDKKLREAKDFIQ